SYQTQSDIEYVEKVCKKVLYVERKKQWSFTNILRTGLSAYPFLLVGHTSLEMTRLIIQELKRNAYDLIHVETSYVMQNLPSSDIPVVLVEHNIEYLVYKRFVKNAPFFVKPLLLFDIMKLKYWEEQFWERVTKLVAVSEEEKRLMKRDDVAVVPNGVDLAKFKIQNSKFKISRKEKRVLFIGDFRWVQNRDAVQWLLTVIWPEIRNPKSLPAGRQGEIRNPKLWIVGKKIPDSIKKLGNDQDVVFDENAPEDAAEIFKNADVLLSPIRVGGGTSFKILEAMASGVSVVTTSLGIEGIQAEDGKEVLIADDVKGLANNIIRVIGDEKMYREIAQKARKVVEEKYDWEIIVKKLEEVYQSVVA
ncbi:MAG: glycosyltransferase family 4 protein, partial [Candidatus Levybacteria bacterium]|nr:glycosyltransferase family 4 protein [Candidatus Levybacteria bacterium]